MKGYDGNFLDELKAKNDIAEVASKYMHVEQKGANFWARCPFHHEKTASFSLNPYKRMFHCFGCHKSGDVITLVQELENVDFNDAVKILAERCGMPLPEVTYDSEKIKAEKEKRQTLYDIMKDTARYYASVLRSKSGAEYMAYANNRGFSLDTLNSFGIGASTDYDGLKDYLLDKGYNLEDCVACGALGKTERNGKPHYYDFLAERFIIPMIDSFGNVVAFSGRLIKDKERAGKYQNTVNTPIFEKGKTFFNINNLKRIKNEKGIFGVIVVEGHLDVVSLVQSGIENVVATMGTAMTKDHARLIKRYTDKVYISYDGDFAGQKATVKGLEILRDEGLDVKVVSLPTGLDPDEVVKKFGAEYYLNLVSNAMPLIDFKLQVLERTFDIKTVDGKRKYVVNAIRVIKESASFAEQEDLLKTVRDKTGVSFDALKRELYSENTDIKESVETVIPEEDQVGDKETVATRFVLYAYLSGRKPPDKELLSDLTYKIPSHAEIKEYLTSSAGSFNIDDICEITDDEKERELITSLEFSENGGEAFEEYYADCVRTLRGICADRKIEDLTKEYKAETDTERRKFLASKIAEQIKLKSEI